MYSDYILIGGRMIGDVIHQVRSAMSSRSVTSRNQMSVHGASKQIIETLLTWNGIQAHPHRFGGTEFRVGRREIGHIHGDTLVDVPFPKKVRDEIVTNGLAEPHHILPETGWGSFYLHKEADVQRAIELLKRSYELAEKQRSAMIKN